MRSKRRKQAVRIGEYNREASELQNVRAVAVGNGKFSYFAEKDGETIGFGDARKEYEFIHENVSFRGGSNYSLSNKKKGSNINDFRGCVTSGEYEEGETSSDWVLVSEFKKTYKIQF